MPSKVNRTDPTDWSQPDADIQQMMRASPILHLRTVLVQFVQGLFWYMPRGNYHWEPNVGETEIVITDESPIKVKDYGTRPCITITRSPIVLNSIGLDDMMTYNMATQTKKKSVVVPGNMTVNCCSRESLESEGLAFFVAEHLWLLRDILQRKSIYQIGQNIGVGAPSPAGSLVAADQGDEWTVTSAAIPFQLIRTGAVTPLGQQVAQAIELSLNSRNAVPTFRPVAFPPSHGSLAQPGAETIQPNEPSASGTSRTVRYTVQTGQRLSRGLRAPRIRGRPIPLAGSGMGES